MPSIFGKKTPDPQKVFAKDLLFYTKKGEIDAVRDLLNRFDPKWDRSLSQDAVNYAILNYQPEILDLLMSHPKGFQGKVKTSILRKPVLREDKKTFRVLSKCFDLSKCVIDGDDLRFIRTLKYLQADLRAEVFYEELEKTKKELLKTREELRQLKAGGNTPKP